MVGRRGLGQGGPGVGRAVAEWMIDGEPEIDLQASDIARFYEHQKTSSTSRRAPPRASTRPTGSSTPPSSGPRTATSASPFHARERELGAVFYEAAGWERPHWYESNAGLVEEYGDARRREAEWESRWWSPIINAEHLAMRDRAAMFDLTAFCIFDVVGPGALECVQRVSMRQMDVKLGKVVYTPVLTPRGGFRSDLTVMRLGDEHFRVVTGGAHGMADLKWYRRPPAGRRQRADLRPHVELVHARPVGPRAATSSRARRATTSRTRASPSPRAGRSRSGPLRVLASRISYVGDLGWELYVPIEQGAKLWDIVWEAGAPHGIVPAGIGVYGTTGPAREVLPRVRLRARRRVRRRRGRHGLGQGQGPGLRRQGGARAPRDEGTRRGDVHADRRRPHRERRAQRYMLGGEPILTRDGAPLSDAQGPALVRHQRRRRAVGRQAPPDVLPAARARRRRRASSPSSTWASASR